MQCWDPSPFGHQDRKGFQVDQPLDFSVKSPGSFGGSERDFCSPHHQDFSTTRSTKSRSSSGGIQVKDEQYYIRRTKNNEAAKRSRDARRQKEEQTKRENERLRIENEKLHRTILNLKTLEEHVSKCPFAHSKYEER